MTDNPKRLLDEDIEPELRTALGAAKALPPEARLAAIGARLPKGPGAGGGGGGWTFGARAGVFGASALVVGVVAYALWPSSSSPSTAAPPVSVAHEPPSPMLPVPPDRSAASVAVPIEALQIATPTTAPMASLPSAKVDPTLEISLLHQAQDALAEHPDVSLARCDEQRRLFPNSSVGQEREVLAIEALVRLGRTSDAQRRADAFQKAYPGSAHQRRVDTLLAHP